MESNDRVTDPLQADSLAAADETQDWSGDQPTDEDLEKLQPFARFLHEALLYPIEAGTQVAEGSLFESEEKSGTRTIGPFHIVRVLGKGGSGIVYLATDPILKRQVALKVPRDSLFMSDNSKARFLQEAKIIAELRNTNIVEIHQVGNVGEWPYLVFEYCASGSLRDWLDRQTQSPSPRCCAGIIQQLATAAHHAHAHGVSHRDINPRNVLLVPLAEGEKTIAQLEFPYVAKLSDFGLGTWLDEERTAVQTQTGIVLGTLPYMAPEQTIGKSIPTPHLIDVYSLGVMLYELLIGKRPFEGLASTETLRLIQQSDPVALRSQRRVIPRELETICLKCLEKEPQRRYPTAAALAEDLERLLSGNPIRTRRVSVIERAVRWLVKRRAQVGIATLIIILLATIGVGGSWYATKLSDALLRERQFKQKSDEHASKLIQAKASEQRHKQAMATHARRAKYNAQIRAVSDLVKSRSYDVIHKLREWIPKTADEPDLRGFEWYHLMQRGGGDVAIMTEFDWSNGRIEAMHVSETGDSVFIAYGNQLSEWKVSSGQQRRIVQQSNGTIRDFAVSQESGQIAVAQRQSPNVEVFDLDSIAKQPRVYNSFIGPDPPNWCNRVMFDPTHSTLFSICAGNQIFHQPWRIYSCGLTSESWTSSIPHDYFRILDLVFDPTLKQMICNANDGIFISSNNNNEMPSYFLSLPTPDGDLISSLAISKDAQLLATSTTRRDILLCQKNLLGRWEYRATLPVTNRRVESNQQDLTHNRSPIRFNRDGKRLFSIGEDDLHLWDVPRNEVVCSITLMRSSEPCYLELLPDGQTAVWTDETAVGLWRPIEDLPPIAGHDKETWSIAFSTDGKLLVTGSDDETVRLWDVTTGKQLGELTGHATTVSAVAFSPRGGLLASGSLDGTVRVWDVATRKLTKTLNRSAGSIRSLAWFSDGKRLVVSDSAKPEFSQKILIWDATTGTVLQTLTGFSRRVHSVLVTADQQRCIGVSDDRTIRIWNVKDGKLLQTWSNKSEVRSAVLLNDERWLAIGGNDGVIHIRDIATGAVLVDLIGHTGRVLTLAISPDGRVLASGGEDKTVRLWDVESGDSLIVFDDQAAQINSLAFSPAGDILASAAHDGSVKLRYGPRFKPLLTNLSK